MAIEYDPMTAPPEEIFGAIGGNPQLAYLAFDELRRHPIPTPEQTASFLEEALSADDPTAPIPDTAGLTDEQKQELEKFYSEHLDDLDVVDQLKAIYEFGARLVADRTLMGDLEFDDEVYDLAQALPPIPRGGLADRAELRTVDPSQLELARTFAGHLAAQAVVSKREREELMRKAQGALPQPVGNA